MKKSSRMANLSKNKKKEKQQTSGGGGTRIGASPNPYIEMSVTSNKNAVILGSVADDSSGLELEWGMSL